MKNTRKQINVKDDQAYLDSINQITGWSIDYNRSQSTDSQINQLSTDSNFSSTQKFLYVLQNGQKIQKYSVLQNMKKYLQSKNEDNNFTDLLTSIKKIALSQPEYLGVIGQGLMSLFEQKNKQKSCQKLILRLEVVNQMCNLLVIVFTNSKLKQLSDWNKIIQILVQTCLNNNQPLNKMSSINKQINKMFQSLKNFINSSFLMNSLPQKRRNGFYLLSSLFKNFFQIRQMAFQKVLFFNDDTNPDTRIIIGQLLLKILSNYRENNLTLKNKNATQQLSETEIKDICRIIKNYLLDKNQKIIERALKAFVLMSDSKLLNKQTISQCLQIYFQQLVAVQTSQAKIKIIIKYLKVILLRKQLSEVIKQQKLYKVKMFSFFNKSLKSIFDVNLALTQQSQIIFESILDVYDQKVFQFQGIEEIELIQQVQLQKTVISKIQVFFRYCGLFKNIKNIQFKDSIKKNILKSFKVNNKNWNYNLIKSQNDFINFLRLLDQQTQEQQVVIIQLCQKTMDISKWNILGTLLQQLKKRAFSINSIQKLYLAILKSLLNCPYFILGKIFQVIVYLIFLNNKSTQFISIIKQKLTKSKNWMHRRNYFLLYCFLKQNTSFQIHKLIPIYSYLSILTEKHSGFKHLFVDKMTQSYQFIDPANKIQRNVVRQVICQLIKLQKQEQNELKQKYLKLKNTIHQVDSSSSAASICYDHNRYLLCQQQGLTNLLIAKKQNIISSKKSIKTQKSIKNQQSQKKIGINNLKKSLNVFSHTRQSLKINNFNGQLQIQKQCQQMLLRQNHVPLKRTSTLNLGKIGVVLNKQNQLGIKNSVAKGQVKLQLQKDNDGIRKDLAKYPRQNKSAYINIRKKYNMVKL